MYDGKVHPNDQRTAVPIRLEIATRILAGFGNSLSQADSPRMHALYDKDLAYTCKEALRWADCLISAHNATRHPEVL